MFDGSVTSLLLSVLACVPTPTFYYLLFLMNYGYNLQRIPEFPGGS